MKVRVIATATVAVGALALGAGLASADPADQSPIDEHAGHPHHIHTGNGDCKDLDQNKFEGGTSHRGLHQGARESEQVHHGPCH